MNFTSHFSLPCPLIGASSPLDDFGKRQPRAPESVRPPSAGTGEISGLEGLTVLDADSDGDSDLAVIGRAFRGELQRVYLLENDGSGSFSLPTEIEIPVFGNVADPRDEKLYSIDSGDVDGDGAADLVLVQDIGSSYLSTVVLLNDRAGSFVLSDRLAGHRGHAGTAIRDFDGDGDLDLLVAGFYLIENLRVR